MLVATDPDFLILTRVNPSVSPLVVNLEQKQLHAKFTTNLQRSHDFFFILIVSVESKIRVMRSGPELVRREHEEHVRSHLFEHLVEPDVLERHRHLQQEEDHPREVDVTDDHQVEVMEQLQLLQVNGGFPVSSGRFLQVPDGPDDGEHDAAATEQIDENEDVAPGVILPRPLLALLQYYLGDVGQNLQRYHGHEQPLIPRRQDVLDERPARADEHQRDEEQRPLQQVRYVEQHGPSGQVHAQSFDEMVVHSVER